MSRHFIVILLFLTIIPGVSFSADDGDIRAVLTDYHKALTAGNIQQVEEFVVADERFAMVEGKHTNLGLGGLPG